MLLRRNREFPRTQPPNSKQECTKLQSVQCKQWRIYKLFFAFPNSIELGGLQSSSHWSGLKFVLTSKSIFPRQRGGLWPKQRLDTLEK